MLAEPRISHLLSVWFSIEPTTPDDVKTIREALRQQLRNVPWTLPVRYSDQEPPMSVTIEWTTATEEDSRGFVAKQLPYIDEIVFRHTTQLLSKLERRIHRQHPECGANWKVTFLLTKPLSTTKAIVVEEDV